MMPPVAARFLASPGPPPAGPRPACAPLRACVTIAPVSDGSSSPAAADLELLQRIAARDEAALASLYDRHSSLAFSVIMRILRSPSDAEDVLQETFVKVWARAETYDPALGTPAAWLTRIARNRAIDRLRAKRVRRDISVEPTPGPDGGAATLPEVETHETPEVVAQGQSLTRSLRSAMALLPATQRDLIEAAFFEGYSHLELAARFGMPLGTVKTRIRTGLTTMRGQLEQLV